MALNEIGSAAGEAADAPRRRDTVVPQLGTPPAATPEPLLDAIRRGLRPADPIGRLLAAWRLTPPTG